MLLFYHNIKKESPFSGEEEALFSLKENKYSILGKIDDSYKLGTQFELLIYYKSRNEIFRWRQDKNPVEENETEGVYSATNFQLISPLNPPANSSWNGLVKQTIIDPNFGVLTTLLKSQAGYRTFFLYWNVQCPWIFCR